MLHPGRSGRRGIRPLPELYVPWGEPQGDEIEQEIAVSGAHSRNRRIAIGIASCRPCVLCGGPPTCAAIFYPARMAERPVAYSLRRGCLELPNRTQRVERALRKRAMEA